MSDTTTDVVDARPADSGSSNGSDHAQTNGSPTGTARRKSGAGLNGMVLAELQQVASGLGITGTGRMRKGQLIEAITAAQSGGSTGSTARASGASTSVPAGAAGTAQPTSDAPTSDAPTSDAATSDVRADNGGQPATGETGPRTRDRDRGGRDQRQRGQQGQQGQQNQQGGQNQQGQQGGQGQQGQQGGGQNQQGQQGQQGQQPGQNRYFDEDDERGGRRRRRGRGRDRTAGASVRTASAARPSPSSARTTSCSRSPASSTCSTTTRFVRTTGLPARPERRLRLAGAGPQARPAQGRRRHRRRPAAQGRRAQGQVQRAGPARHGQRRSTPRPRATVRSSTS